MIKVSYSSDDLIQEVKEDISIFGKGFNVYAVFSWYPEFDKEFITDYVHADKPTRDECVDEKDFQDLLEIYDESIKTLEKTKHEKMTLQELLNKLIEQNKII